MRALVQEKGLFYFRQITDEARWEYLGHSVSSYVGPSPASRGFASTGCRPCLGRQNSSGSLFYMPGQQVKRCGQKRSVRINAFCVQEI